MTDKVPITPVLIQVLGYIPGLRYFSNFYKYIIHTADPRADKYPLMGNPDTTAAVVLSYLLFCLMFGPKYMRNRETPTYTRWMLCFYNLITIYMNGFLALALTHYVFSTKQSLLCEPVNYTKEADTSWVMTLLYIFHLSKIVELVDTVFLVWKKKNGQLSFLHIYHHSTIVAATWIGVKFAPGGTTAVICMINSWIHVFMYVYYQLTAIRVNLSKKYKKFLTLVQMGQFCYTLAVCANGLWIAPCNYPDWIFWWLFLYMLSFLILFSNFFYETYAKKKANVRNLQIHSTAANFKEAMSLRQSIISDSNHFTNGATNGLIGGEVNDKSGYARNGQTPSNASTFVRIKEELHLNSSHSSQKTSRGYDLASDQHDPEHTPEDIIFNEVIGLTRVRRKQQLSAEVKIVNNSIEVTNSSGSVSSRNQEKIPKDSTKVRKLRKKKSQKRK